MAKKKSEGEYQGLDEEDLTDEEKEQLEESEGEDKPKRSSSNEESRTVNKRYEAIHQQEVLGIRDTESNELIAQGFNNLGDAMVATEVIERLERIETLIGSIIQQ